LNELDKKISNKEVSKENSLNVSNLNKTLNSFDVDKKFESFVDRENNRRKNEQNINLLGR
jgi:hypothetical protein